MRDVQMGNDYLYLASKKSFSTCGELVVDCEYETRY